MGISASAARVLLNQAAEKPFSGSVMQLGRQKIYFTYAEVERWSGESGVPISGDVLSTIEDKESIVTDTDFFTMLGFDEVHSCDMSAYEGSTHIVDLNEPLPEELIGKYDTVFDGGTIEHVFDQRTVFKNIHDLLKTPGRIIHFSPGTHWVDHGFYMYSPLFFYEFYTANVFDILVSQIWTVKKHASNSAGSWTFYDYTPGSLRWRMHSFPGPMGVYFIAGKTEQTIRDKIPQQGEYVQKWSDRDEEAVQVVGNVANGSEAGQLKTLLKRSPVVLKISLWIRGRLPWGKMPPKVGRY